MAKIYLSSTYEGLKEHYKAVYTALRQSRHDVFGMEYFTSADEHSLAQCLANLATCDIYIGIIAWRYGFVPTENNPEQRSLIELEYRHAVTLGKPCLMFLQDKEAPLRPMDFDGDPERILMFRDEIQRTRAVTLFRSPDDLAGKVMRELAHLEAVTRSEESDIASAKARRSSKQSSKKARRPVKGSEGEVSETSDAEGGNGASAQQQAQPPLPKGKQGLADGASERNAVNDRPVDDVKKDRLGFDTYVYALKEFIVSQDTTTPLTISINGRWGSGKSSLMRMLQSELEPKMPPGMWRVKLRWTIGYLWGTFMWLVARLLAPYDTVTSKMARLALSFDPAEDLGDERGGLNILKFKALLDKHFDASPYVPWSLVWPKTDEDRLGRAKLYSKAWFWAWPLARRRRMVPRRHPTVWFNAWKFNQQEQVWSALALAVLEQLKTKFSFFTRLSFLVRLTYKRTDLFKTLVHLLRKLVVPLALAAAVALYQFYFGSEGRLKEYRPGYLSWLGNWPWALPVLAAVWKAWKEIEDPFRLPVKELVDEPDYKQKVGFIGTFEEDFARIVDVAARRSFFWQPRKLVVFIDDLDRCTPLQAVSIIEAVNLFLDSVGCVFVLGMDMAAVATSIEVKYKELTERMRRDAPDVVSPGSLFLDKIVQIPFNVPRPTKKYISALVTGMTEPRAREGSPVARGVVGRAFEGLGGLHSQTGEGNGDRGKELDLSDAVTLPSSGGDEARKPEPASVDRAGFVHDDVREAILFASQLLKENPRQVKRFINLFRLQVYIAHRRTLLDENGLTPRALAVWVAWYMQWPELVKALSDPPTAEEVCRHLTAISESLELQEAKGKKESKACWKAEAGEDYYWKRLKGIRDGEKDSPSHWSKLPWDLWAKDKDFLFCLKELEQYWTSADLLDSMLDMSQVTVGAGSEATAAASVSTITAAAPAQAE